MICNPTFWWIWWGGVGWVPWRPQGILGSGHAACHQVPFTLGACQSKQKTSLWSSVNSLWSVSMPPAPTTYSQPLPGSSPPSSPLSSNVLFSSPSVPPPSDPLLKFAVHFPQKWSPYPPLISVSSYAIQKLNLEKKKGVAQKELSFTFANQIRFKMVRRHERVTLKLWDRHAGWIPTARLVQSWVTLTALACFPVPKNRKK